jgi:hypothetical protein
MGIVPRPRRQPATQPEALRGFEQCGARQTFVALMRSSLNKTAPPGGSMSIIEQALVEWRRKRGKVSDHRQTNIEAWLVELQAVLAEHGLSESQVAAYLDRPLRSMVENEYAQCEKKPPGG